MNIYDFKNCVYEGDINRDFFIFCLKKNKKLLKFALINVVLYLLSFFSKKAEIKYNKKRFNYFKELTNINKLVNDFKASNDQKINDAFNEIYKKGDLIIAKYPDILVKAFLKSKNYIAYEIDKNGYIVNDLNINEKVVNNEKIVINSNLHDDYLKLFKNNDIYLCKKNLLIKVKNYKYKLQLLKKTIYYLSFLLIPLFITLMSFIYANPVVDMKIISTYFQDIKLFMLNYIPIMLIYLILIFISKRIYFGFGFLSFLILLLGIVNQTKLIYRDDFFIFEDILLFKEAALMATKYEIFIAWYTIFFVIIIILGIFYLKKVFKIISITLIPRALLSIILIFISIFVYKNVLTNEKIYNSVGDLTVVNRWIATRQYQIRGFVYPFIYTSRSFIKTPPEGYDEGKAKKLLSDYSYVNIEDNQKVNIIAIMLEAFNDFSKFDTVEFNEDIYAPLHKIQEESYYGSLIVNVFGGGTINTERAFLTGYNIFPNFRKSTNSYPRYFKDQGYIVEAMHPVYGAFYNRNTGNLNMGFDFYYNYENTFSKKSNEFLMDWDFYDYIIDGYEKAVSKNKPYFNFSVTYQNHGPYNTILNEGNEIIVNVDSNESTEAMVNNYFNGIKETNLALEKLVDYFDKQNEPVVIIFFGDHNPFLGDKNVGFSAMGIDLSLNSLESFENYYSTPYVIHANEAAKKTLNKDFIGHGNTISPMFLMNEFFDYVGWKGNEYLQYTSDLKKEVDVIHKMYYKSQGDYILTTDFNNKQIISNFNYVNYYWAFENLGDRK